MTNYNNVRQKPEKGKYTLIKGAADMKSRKIFIKSKKTLLKDFDIEVTDEILNHIDSLYPNEMAVERYTRGLIFRKLKN